MSDCPYCGSFSSTQATPPRGTTWTCGTYQMSGLDPTRSPRCWSIGTQKQITAARAAGYEAATRDAAAWLRARAIVMANEALRAGEAGRKEWARSCEHEEAVCSMAANAFTSREHVGAGDAK